MLCVKRLQTFAQTMPGPNKYVLLDEADLIPKMVYDPTWTDKNTQNSISDFC